MPRTARTQTSRTRATRKTAALTVSAPEAPETKPKRRGRFDAVDVMSAFYFAKSSADTLAARCLVFDADKETFDELYSVGIALFGALCARQRLAGR